MDKVLFMYLGVQSAQGENFNETATQFLEQMGMAFMFILLVVFLFIITEGMSGSRKRGL